MRRLSTAVRVVHHRDVHHVFNTCAPHPGVSHLLEYMAFKGTKNRTHFRLVREVEAIGANVLASATREQVCRER